MGVMLKEMDGRTEERESEQHLFHHHHHYDAGNCIKGASNLANICVSCVTRSRLAGLKGRERVSQEGDQMKHFFQFCREIVHVL